MLRESISQMKTAVCLLMLLMLITGLLYPLLVTVLAQFFFPQQANGRLIEKNGQLIGSVLIGQAFYSPHYFWGRPSATQPFPYNAAASSGSNMGPSNPDFLANLHKRVQFLQKFNGDNNSFIPVDLITASASGLDPEISPIAAFYQVPRIANARHLQATVIQDLITKYTKDRTLTLLGEPRVNVLQLNLALDELK